MSGLPLNSFRARPHTCTHPHFTLTRTSNSPTLTPPSLPLFLSDFEGTTLSLGKPALNDITQGLATAPVLFAAHRYPNLLPIIQRKFEVPGDVDMAVKGIQAAGGMALTRKLAVAHGQLALDALKPLADSPARTALASMVSKILSRSR